MKKKLLFLLTLFACGIVFSQEGLISDIAIYKDISQSFENEYYPGTIEKADKLHELYPDSVFTQSALFYKARALINLTYYEEAVSTLKNAISYMHTGKEGYAQCHYLLGIAYYYLNDYENAISSFYVACKVATLNNETEIYNYSILYSAECYYSLGQYKDAANLYEYVIENGKSFSHDDYVKTLKNIMISYNKSCSYNKTVDLYNSLKKMSLPENFFDKDSELIIKLIAGTAFEKEGFYDKAFNLFSQIIKSGNESYAVAALKNAYLLSESKKIDVSIGELFSSTASNFKNNQNVVNDFWIRLGIDEYNNKNFEKAETYFNNVNIDSDIVKIYRIKMILDTDFSTEAGLKAEKLLKEITVNDDISDAYYSLLLQSKYQQNLWDDVPEIFEKINNPDSNAIYINSAYYYKNGEYEKVSPDTGVLYGSALAKSGDYNKACKVFEELNARNQLTSLELSEYAKVLFHLGRYEDAYNVVLESSDDHKDYIAGLCKINTNDLDSAKNCLITYIKKMSNRDNFIQLALYYKGYVEYSLGDYKNAFNSFVRFNLEADDKYFPYIKNSHYYCAIASLQNKDYDRAANEAGIVVKMSLNREDKIKATVFNFEILSDSGKYDQAISLMMPYANERSDFSPEALFRIAGVYAKQGKAKLADETYKTIYDNYHSSVYAEESFYRRGEVYYFVEDYHSAYNRFTDYVNTYVSGKFLDGALYFSGDCALKLGRKEKAIMFNNIFNLKFTDSIYSYGVNKNLLTAYYDNGNYEQALEVAKKLMKLYPEQAASDKVGTKIIELEKIIAGADRRIVEKLADYDNAGGSGTKEGRKIGSEIVKLYWENNKTHGAGFALAVELLEKQTEPDELVYAAENAELAGLYSMSINENKDAAGYYLKAAQSYRSLQNEDRAAAALYSAADAFVSAELMGDAKETADLLKELYPDTNYAQSVDKIVR